MRELPLQHGTRFANVATRAPRIGCVCFSSGRPLIAGHRCAVAVVSSRGGGVCHGPGRQYPVQAPLDAASPGTDRPPCARGSGSLLPLRVWVRTGAKVLAKPALHPEMDFVVPLVTGGPAFKVNAASSSSSSSYSSSSSSASSSSSSSSSVSSAASITLPSALAPSATTEEGEERNTAKNRTKA